MNRRASIFIAVGVMLLAVAHGPAEAAGGYSVRSSKHFRVIYKSSEASAAYARFILDNSERAWKQIFGPLGYQQPKWLADRVKAGGLLQLRISKIKHLGMAMWESSVIGGKVVVTGGGLMIDLESRFKKAGKTQWELLRATCAHELFHIVQYGYDHKESKWLKETTATWIEDKVFPAEAKKAPKLYGFRFYLGRWNKHRRHYPLFTTGGSHEYAAAIFHQYLSEHDSRGNAVVRELWQEAAKVRGDTMLTALAAVVKDATKLGPNTQRRVTDLALADLIRSSKRSRKYSLATFLKGPFISPPLRKAAGLAIPGEKNGLLGSIGRTVATYAFDHVRLYADALKVGREVDVVVAVRGSADGAWAFQLVRAPRGDQWKVLDFPKPAGTNWTTLRVGAVDFTEEKLYVVATRLSITSSDKYRLSAMVLTPPIVKSFKVDAPSDEAGTGREEVWSIQRTALPRPEGTIWQTALVKKTGIAYRPEEQARFTVEFSRKMRGPLKLLLGSDVSVTLTAADKFSEKFTGSVAIRTLEKFLADGHIPVEVRGSDVFNMGLDGNVETSPRLVFKGSAAPKIASIERWEGNEPGAKRPGGVDNLSGRTIPLYKPEKPRPRLVGVKLWRRDSREVFYHDPGGAFRPVTPGLVEVRLYFRGAMDTTAKAEVAFSGNAIEGKWSGAKTWVGTFEVSAQAAGFAKVKGAHALSVQAKAAYGTMFDGDPEKPGDQPDTTHRFVIDTVPPYIEAVEVFGKGRKYYEGYWTDGPNIAREANLSTATLGSPVRRLKIRTLKSLPADGRGTLFVTVRTSGPLADAPRVTIGGQSVRNIKPDASRKHWMGEVPLADIRQDVKDDKPVPIVISAADAYGNALDADPRTVPTLETKAPWWTAYEDRRGGASRGRGGDDRWHEIGRATRISLVILLDASGSMAENNRMVNAKRAIVELLKVAPTDVEIAVIMFGNERVWPVPFTHDREAVLDATQRANAYGSTPLAAAIAHTRTMLAASSHPMSFDWRYRIFSDGKETCGGNVIAETRKLNEAIALRRGAKPRPRKDKVPPPRPVAKDAIECRPTQWMAYMVKVDSRATLDWISLLEVTFTEKQLPDGRCSVVFEAKPYGVAYGAIRDRDGGPTTIKWRINSRPSPSEVKRATSDDGKAAVERVRRHAEAVRRQCKSLDKCRQEIQQNVEREIRENASHEP